ncbi:hypothetical protein [Phocaeicola oris]|uniref:hypothetical protein n=1 Tax=Phocaeicola oris TaxID=2896850 RepID=UPI00234EABC7|nr:hypothetical protein [Phocaeicola oris]MCE2616049.1 hypothetical protein [Phocaeicola oris]
MERIVYTDFLGLGTQLSVLFHFPRIPFNLLWHSLSAQEEKVNRIYKRRKYLYL